MKTWTVLAILGSLPHINLSWLRGHLIPFAVFSDTQPLTLLRVHHQYVHVIPGMASPSRCCSSTRGRRSIRVSERYRMATILSEEYVRRNKRVVISIECTLARATLPPLFEIVFVRI
ncbi:hypothetical protein F4823DRAFT_589529 [Ustulina deusta]|nr:hypothetical protein F4823DRAFT_589529 [Ustulina deusta]